MQTFQIRFDDKSLSLAASQSALICASESQGLMPGQLWEGVWVYIFSASVCCIALIVCPHRTYKGGMRPHVDLNRTAAERVHVKLYANSAQQPGHALCQFSRLSISDARRLVALLGPNTYKWNDGKQLQLAPEALQAVLQWQTVAGEYLAHLG